MSKYGHLTEKEVQQHFKEKEEEKVVKEIDTEPHQQDQVRTSKIVNWFYYTFFWPLLIMHEVLHWCAAKLLCVDVTNKIIVEDDGYTIDFEEKLREIAVIKTAAIGLAPLGLVPVGVSAVWMTQYFSWWPITVFLTYIAVGSYLLARPSVDDMTAPFYSLKNSKNKSIRKEPVGAVVAVVLFVFAIPLLILDTMDSRTGILVDVMFMRLLDVHFYSIILDIGVIL